ncbi:MAG: CinA family nicotinamide mononucleotide deamidase-related protein [Muribaculaceae bacterium]|nr:CinA family nicotinamide mononucleotide deamidase-related protein [Muribaculaceae bacterium]
MRYSTIVIGDELLIGQVTDTNSGFFARQLVPYGWQAISVQVVADEAEAIKQALDRSFSESDVVLTTGGLGPTKDDITKLVLRDYFGGTMVHDEETTSTITRIMRGRGLELNDYTRSQAMVPSSCRVIQNECGTAPIMWFERDGKILVSMPGVPYECETMFVREVLPQLIAHFNRDMSIEFRHLMVMGITESALAMKLDEWERKLPDSIHLAYLPQAGLVRLRLTGLSSEAEVLHEQMNTLAEELHVMLKCYIVAEEDKPLSAILGDLLRNRGLTVSTAESCTGGNIAHEITRIAGSSDYYIGSVVSYHRKVKESMLHVPAHEIDMCNVVSEQVAKSMAQGACRALKTDCSVATTGVAGPGGGTKDIPVGTVWMAATCAGKTLTRCKHIPGHRERVIQRATNEALMLLIELLQSEKSI